MLPWIHYFAKLDSQIYHFVTVYSSCWTFPLLHLPGPHTHFRSSDCTHPQSSNPTYTCEILCHTRLQRSSAWLALTLPIPRSPALSVSFLFVCSCCWRFSSETLRHEFTCCFSVPRWLLDWFPVVILPAACLSPASLLELWFHKEPQNYLHFTVCCWT